MPPPLPRAPPSRRQRSSSFPRPTRSHAYSCSRLTRQHVGEQSGLVTLTLTDLLTLKVVSESHVTWATPVPILVFLGLSVLSLSLFLSAHRRVGTAGGCSGDRGNVSAVRNYCYVAVCSAAQVASAPVHGGRRGRGISWRRPAYSLYCMCITVFSKREYREGNRRSGVALVMRHSSTGSRL